MTSNIENSIVACKLVHRKQPLVQPLNTPPPLAEKQPLVTTERPEKLQPASIERPLVRPLVNTQQLGTIERPLMQHTRLPDTALKKLKSQLTRVQLAVFVTNSEIITLIPPFCTE